MRKMLLTGICFACAAIGLSIASHFFGSPDIYHYGAFWAVSAVAAAIPLAIGKESWVVIERLLTEKVTQLINMFGRRFKSTGALCSPFSM